MLRDELEELCQQQGNYKNLRAKIAEDQEQNKKSSAEAACPIIPYLGMFLTDLTFGEEGNSDYVATEHFPLDSKVMFNMAKLTLMSKTILQLRSYCAGAYPFTFDRSYHQLLCSLQVRNHLDISALSALLLSLFVSWPQLPLFAGDGGRGVLQAIKAI